MDETWFEKIEQYLNGEMSAEEKLLFESEMRKNSELSSAFNMYKNIETGMRDKEKYSGAEEALKNSLSKLNAVYFPGKTDTKELTAANKNKTFIAENNDRKKIIWRPFAIAAATISVIAIGVFIYFESTNNSQVVFFTKKNDTGTTIKADATNSSTNTTQNKLDTNAAETKQPTLATKKPEELFADNFKPDATPENTEGNLEDAFTYYKNRDYTRAAAEFTNVDLNEGTRDLEPDTKLTAFYADYYGGISYLAQGVTGKAINHLKKAAAKSFSNLYRNKAEWYLALAYLKTGDTKHSKELLIKISADKSAAYKSKSEKLLDELSPTE
jgi:hypothetical protein